MTAFQRKQAQGAAYEFTPSEANYASMSDAATGCPLVQKELCGNGPCPTLPPTPEPTGAPSFPTFAPTLHPAAASDCSCGVGKPCMHTWERGRCFKMQPQWNVYLWR